VQYQHDYKEKFHHEDKKSKMDFAKQQEPTIMSELLMQYKKKNIAPRKLGLIKQHFNENKEHELKLDN
jgi:hypothetical protein